MAVPGHSETVPIGEINTTPLIDVMLVLLIMFIITIPMQSHAVKVDLPGVPPPVVIERLKNRLVITEDNRLFWNGSPLSKAELQQTLVAMRRMPVTPELQLQPEPGARYLLVDEVLAMTKRAGVHTMGFVGNERYATF